MGAVRTAAMMLTTEWTRAVGYRRRREWCLRIFGGSGDRRSGVRTGILYGDRGSRPTRLLELAIRGALGLSCRVVAKGLEQVHELIVLARG